jgi:hypothetical protein
VKVVAAISGSFCSANVEFVRTTAATFRMSMVEVSFPGVFAEGAL